MPEVMKHDERQTKLIRSMVELNKGDPLRIQHFLKVWGFARLIGELEKIDDATQYILETAAIVHDIGIRTCLEKYGTCNGKQQELEGPPIAERMLKGLGYDEKVIERVSFLVGHHHTYTDVEGLDWQILLEADFLVNSFESKSSKDAIETFEKKVFRTKSGMKLLELQSEI